MTTKEKQLFLNYLRNAKNTDIQNLGISEEIAPLDLYPTHGNFSYSIESLNLKNTLTISFVRSYWEELDETDDTYDYPAVCGSHYLADYKVLLELKIPNLSTWSHFSLFKYIFTELQGVIAL